MYKTEQRDPHFLEQFTKEELVDEAKFQQIHISNPGNYAKILEDFGNAKPSKTADHTPAFLNVFKGYLPSRIPSERVRITSAMINQLTTQEIIDEAKNQKLDKFTPGDYPTPDDLRKAFMLKLIDNYGPKPPYLKPFAKMLMKQICPAFTGLDLRVRDGQFDYDISLTTQLLSTLDLAVLTGEMTNQKIVYSPDLTKDELITLFLGELLTNVDNIKAFTSDFRTFIGRRGKINQEIKFGAAISNTFGPGKVPVPVTLVRDASKNQPPKPPLTMGGSQPLYVSGAGGPKPAPPIGSVPQRSGENRTHDAPPPARIV